MRILNVKYILNEVIKGDLEFLKSMEVHIPSEVENFIFLYGGKKIFENCFFANGINYIISLVLPIRECNNPSIELILPSIRNKNEGIYRKDLIPFAIDPGGNPYYLSLGSSDYNNVYIDKTTSRGYEEPILKIADSFEEFINGLQPEEVIS